MQEAKAKLRKLIQNLFTGGMFARYDAETTRRIVMVNVDPSEWLRGCIIREDHRASQCRKADVIRRSDRS